MRNNVEILRKLNENLEAAREDLETINKEEQLLEWEATQFPQLQHMFIQKEPYDKLWTTALAFHNKSDEWLNGEAALSSVDASRVRCRPCCVGQGERTLFYIDRRG